MTIPVYITTETADDRWDRKGHVQHAMYINHNAEKKIYPTTTQTLHPQEQVNMYMKITYNQGEEKLGLALQ